jgi:hypothetical protein
MVAPVRNILDITAYDSYWFKQVCVHEIRESSGCKKTSTVEPPFTNLIRSWRTFVTRNVRKPKLCVLSESYTATDALPSILPACRQPLLLACVFVNRDTIRHPRLFFFGKFVRDERRSWTDVPLYINFATTFNMLPIAKQQQYFCRHARNYLFEPRLLNVPVGLNSFNLYSPSITVQCRNKIPNYSQTLLFNVYCLFNVYSLETGILVTLVLRSSLLDFNLRITAFMSK